jgi:hypothetical protein
MFWNFEDTCLTILTLQILNVHVHMRWVQGGTLFAKIFEIDREIFYIGKNLWNWPWILMWSARRPVFPLILDPSLCKQGIKIFLCFYVLKGNQRLGFHCIFRVTRALLPPPLPISSVLTLHLSIFWQTCICFVYCNTVVNMTRLVFLTPTYMTYTFCMFPLK